jgi:HK97 family phage portal protein
MNNPYATISFDAAPVPAAESRGVTGEELWIPPASSSAGMLVTERTALTLPSILTAVNVLSTDAALFPLRVYQKRSDGGRDSRPAHKVDYLLSVSPNGETIPIVWRQALISHALLYGNGYAEIQRIGRGTPDSLHLLEAESTCPTRIDGKLRYKLGNGRTLDPINVIHIRGLGYNGIEGYNFVRMLRGSVGLGLAQQSYTGDFYANGSDPGGWIEVPQKLNPEAQKGLRESWESIHGGPGNRHRIGVLEQGATYKQNPIDPEKAQLLESRKFQVMESTRPWRLPPHKLGDYSQAHLANLETSNLDYLMTALMPWLVAVEQEMTLKLFTPAEIRAGFYVEHNVAALLRGDIVSRYNAYHQALADGWINRDEVRARENLCPIGEEAGGTKHLVQVNQTTLEKIGEDETLESPDVARFEETQGEEYDGDDGSPAAPVEEPESTETPVEEDQ